MNSPLQKKKKLNVNDNLMPAWAGEWKLRGSVCCIESSGTDVPLSPIEMPLHPPGPRRPTTTNQVTQKDIGHRLDYAVTRPPLWKKATPTTSSRR